MAATLRLLTAPSSMGRGALCCACDAWDGRKLRSCAWTSDAIDPRHAQCGKQNTAFNTLGRQKLRSGPGSSGCNRTVAERAACHFISAHWLCARNGSDPAHRGSIRCVTTLDRGAGPFLVQSPAHWPCQPPSARNGLVKPLRRRRLLAGCRISVAGQFAENLKNNLPRRFCGLG